MPLRLPSCKTKLIFALITILGSHQLHAACASPAGVDGEMRYDTTNSLRVCNNTSWTAVNGTNTAVACTIAGEIKLNSSLLQVCHSGYWHQITNTSRSYASCSGYSIGYFYYGAGYYWVCSSGSIWRQAAP